MIVDHESRRRMAIRVMHDAKPGEIEVQSLFDDMVPGLGLPIGVVAIKTLRPVVGPRRSWPYNALLVWLPRRCREIGPESANTVPAAGPLMSLSRGTTELPAVTCPACMAGAVWLKNLEWEAWCSTPTCVMAEK